MAIESNNKEFEAIQSGFEKLKEIEGEIASKFKKDDSLLKAM